MSTPVGRREFFALEAGEYLERLALLAGGSTAPDAEALVRYARALRGAALMAGPPGYAVAAAAIESIAKGHKDGRLDWNSPLAEQLSHAIEDCKALLRRLKEWSDIDVQRSERIAQQLDRLSGSAALPGAAARGAPRGSSADLSAGIRAYVAREAAAVAATLEHVADAVERFPLPGSAGPVVQRLQPLRGMGALPGLSPLPELLESLDLTIAWASRGGAWPPRSGLAFRTAAAALARMARDIAELGMPQADSHEVVRATELLREAFANDADAVPIASLFLAGDLNPIVHRGTPPNPATIPVDTGVELTSLADRLRHAAEAGGEGVSRAARTLSLQALVMTLRGLAMSSDVRSATGPFFCRLDREAMASRVTPLVLRRAADVIVAAVAAGGVSVLGEALLPLAAELDRLGGVAAVARSAPSPAAAPPPEIDVIPIELLAPETGIVPIETLAPDADVGVVPIESLLLPPYLPFEQTFSSYFQLLTGTGARPAPVAPVPIQDLLYHGRRALERADLVRRELDQALSVRRDLASIETLLAELLDLVPLALDDQR
jgi:hypothetical protein